MENGSKNGGPKFKDITSPHVIYAIESIPESQNVSPYYNNLIQVRKNDCMLTETPLERVIICLLKRHY